MIGSQRKEYFGPLEKMNVLITSEKTSEQKISLRHGFAPRQNTCSTHLKFIVFSHKENPSIRKYLNYLDHFVIHWMKEYLACMDLLSFYAIISCHLMQKPIFHQFHNICFTQVIVIIMDIHVTTKIFERSMDTSISCLVT